MTGRDAQECPCRAPLAFAVAPHAVTGQSPAPYGVALLHMCGLREAGHPRPPLAAAEWDVRQKCTSSGPFGEGPGGGGSQSEKWPRKILQSATLFPARFF